MFSRMTPSRRQVLRDLAILLLITLVMVLALALGTPVWADSIQLTGEARVGTGDVKLRDVARLEGPEAEKLGDVVVSNLADREMFVSIDSIRDLLTKRNTNWGLISLRGYAKCRVQRIEAPAAPGPAEIEIAEPAVVVANPKREVVLDGPATVKDRIVGLVTKMTDSSRDDLRITFASDDTRLLAQPAVGGDRYEFEPQSSTGLGRVPVIVRRWHGERLMATDRVSAVVARRYLAVVAAGTVSRGDTFTSDDVEIKEVFLDQTRGTPMSDLSRVIGQECTAQIRKGAVVFAGGVKSPVLVKRGELMTVRSVAGSLVVKTTARAGEEGTLDQIIQVRNERSRGAFYVKVTGSQEGLVVAGAGEPEAPQPRPDAKPAHKKEGARE